MHGEGANPTAAHSSLKTNTDTLGKAKNHACDEDSIRSVRREALWGKRGSGILLSQERRIACRRSEAILPVYSCSGSSGRAGLSRNS